MAGLRKLEVGFLICASIETEVEENLNLGLKKWFLDLVFLWCKVVVGVDKREVLRLLKRELKSVLRSLGSCRMRLRELPIRVSIVIFSLIFLAFWCTVMLTFGLVSRRYMRFGVGWGGEKKKRRRYDSCRVQLT